MMINTNNYSENRYQGDKINNGYGEKHTSIYESHRHSMCHLKICSGRRMKHITDNTCNDEIFIRNVFSVSGE